MERRGSVSQAHGQWTTDSSSHQSFQDDHHHHLSLLYDIKHRPISLLFISSPTLRLDDIGQR